MDKEDKLVEILEGFDIDEDKIVQIISQLKEKYDSKKLDNVVFKSSVDIELAIENERDNVKKAVLVAKKISRSLDE